MEYTTYKRFKGKSISGEINIPFGTILQEHDGMLYLDGKMVCYATSENGWEHFRPLTDEGKYRQDMLDKLYRWYTKNGCGEDFTDDKWPGQENGYWKNRLRTASTSRLKQIYAEKIGGKVCLTDMQTV